MTARSTNARRVGALLTAGVGGMNILSALLPGIPSRVAELRDLVPVHLMRGAQTATVLVGFLLILLADGLRKRRRRAMYIVVILLLASSALNIVKGLDFEEASIAAILACGLLVNERAFNVVGPTPAPHRIFRRIGAFALLYYCYVLSGFFILRGVIRPSPSFWGATVEPFRLFMDAANYRYLTAQAGWFERSLPFVGSVAAILALSQILRPLIPRRHASPAELGRVRRLVRDYGSDTLSYFSLQNDRHYLFDESGLAFLSYRLWGNVALVGGDPVGEPRHFRSLLDSFLGFAYENGLDPCFLGISDRYLQLYGERGMYTLKIGEEAMVDLRTFDRSALKRKVRRAVRHGETLGLKCTRYARPELPPGVLAQMEEISRLWVGQKGGSERGFSMTLGRLPDVTDRDCEVIVAGEGDFVWGYLVMVPVYQGNAWSLDAMRRRSDSPNGLMEYLLVHAMESYSAEGCRALGLNFASLSNRENDIESRALEGTRRFLFEHLSSFYQLKSLYQFNNKFDPAWNSRYMAYPNVLKFPKLALAIVQSEDPIRLPSVATVFRR